jgi:hypothetical protein
MWGEVISGITLIIVALIEMVAARGRKREKEARALSERRAVDRAKENRLAMKMMDASLDLSLATAMAVEQCKINGEMKTAKEKARVAQKDYQEFLQEIAARQIAKV